MDKLLLIVVIAAIATLEVKGFVPAETDNKKTKANSKFETQNDTKNYTNIKQVNESINLQNKQISSQDIITDTKVNDKKHMQVEINKLNLKNSTSVSIQKANSTKNVYRFNRPSIPSSKFNKVGNRTSKHYNRPLPKNRSYKKNEKKKFSKKRKPLPKVRSLKQTSNNTIKEKTKSAQKILKHKARPKNITKKNTQRFESNNYITQINQYLDEEIVDARNETKIKLNEKLEGNKKISSTEKPHWYKVIVNRNVKKQYRDSNEAREIISDEDRTTERTKAQKYEDKNTSHDEMEAQYHRSKGSYYNYLREQKRRKSKSDWRHHESSRTSESKEREVDVKFDHKLQQYMRHNKNGIFTKPEKYNDQKTGGASNDNYSTQERGEIGFTARVKKAIINFLEG